jgi:hypothetical protein
MFVFLVSVALFWHFKFYFISKCSNANIVDSELHVSIRRPRLSGMGGRSLPWYDVLYYFTVSSPCGDAKPLTDSSGVDLYCGRGGQRCPLGSYCDIHPGDRYAKCCPNKGNTQPNTIYIVSVICVSNFDVQLFQKWLPCKYYILHTVLLV